MASPAGDIGVPGDKVEEKAPAPSKPAEVKTATVEEAVDLDVPGDKVEEKTPAPAAPKPAELKTPAAEEDKVEEKASAPAPPKPAEVKTATVEEDKVEENASAPAPPKPAEVKTPAAEEGKVDEKAPAPAPPKPAEVKTPTIEEDKVGEKAPAPPKPAEVKTATVEEADDLDDVPDPDEDDLDDLDDLLDEFSAAKIEPKQQPQVSPDQGRPAAAARAEPLLSDDEFAKQLQEGMAELLGNMENPEVQAEFESIFKELGTEGIFNQISRGAAAEAALREAPGADSTARSVPPSATTAAPATSASAEAAEASFQETIKRTMERMQASGEQATAAAAAEGTDDFLAEMLKQMGGGAGLDAGGEGNEEEFSKMLLGMMEQLTNKEILYEPMKELDEKFPDWLVKNKAATSKEDLKRYELQQGLVKEIVAKFEEKTYSDSKKEDREYIVERMQKMQDAGSPPPDLVGDMPSTQDVMSMPDESCNPQ